MCIKGPKTTLLHRSFLCVRAGVLRIQGTSASSPFSSTAVFLEKKNALYLKPSKNTASSNEWLKRQLSDPYVRWARVDQYRCRSAFKLLEIDEKQKLLLPGMTVVDCGAAPGSWTQVLVKRCNSKLDDKTAAQGKVIAVDIQEMQPIDGANILDSSDFTSLEAQSAVLKLLLPAGGVDAVVSDMAPAPSGMKDFDHEVIVKLSYSALNFCLKISNVGGFFLTKIWDGRLREKLENDLKLFYGKVQVVKPKSSRSDSSEIFVLARDFKGLKK